VRRHTLDPLAVQRAHLELYIRWMQETRRFKPSTVMLRHTFVTTMLDAGVDLRDVQIAARHADPRTTMRYDRARQNLDRHPNYILAAFMASGT
jgi:site-specific recombinase XerD